MFDMEYANEHVFTFHIVEGEDGKLRVAHVEEFVDSAASLQFFPALRAKLAERDKQQ